MLRVFLYSSKLARSKIEMILQYILLLRKDMAHSCAECVKDSILGGIAACVNKLCRTSFGRTEENNVNTSVILAQGCTDVPKI
jgi:hypothetical protein